MMRMMMMMMKIDNDDEDDGEASILSIHIRLHQSCLKTSLKFIKKIQICDTNGKSTSFKIQIFFYSCI